MRKIILMGAIGCGKTTLCQALNGDNLSYNKTQAVSYYTDIIDTPGEFVLHRQYYSALSVSAADAQVIGLVQSVTELEQVFSPGFASMFPKQVVGIVSKTDLAKDAKQIDLIRQQLQSAGAEKIFYASSINHSGLEELEGFLKNEQLEF
ncbi:EutP/PduV family microcompartment system protein [Enterococcus xiangfangensis]|uniref:EutP/PduV family microcompartment system protein n=1 Tax=Enterococcus xiangfangensis TaxID=1296537 RepID=UPI0010F89CBA|nr:EutP/PduV family microcompartment system protein [Enterococcus xiangfangensis]MBM7711515.1 ethanolamine utilization protein EutP [Enterococcus xiangfangensis]